MQEYPYPPFTPALAPAPQSSGGGIPEFLKKIPWWGWIAVAVVAYFVFKNLISGAQSVASGGTTDPGSAGTGGGTDSGALGIGGATDPGATGGTDIASSSNQAAAQIAAAASGPATPSKAAPAAAPKPAPKPAAKPAAQHTMYTVRSGDTLGDIGWAHGTNAEALWQLNSSTLDATARQHGFASSDNGWWIFPGEVIRLN